MAKQILFNNNARKSLKKGIDTLAEAVKMTLGPRGRAVVIDKGYGAPQVTLDGVTVGKAGVVTIEDSNTGLNSSELVEGMQFDKGYVSPYMITNPDRMEAEYED